MKKKQGRQTEKRESLHTQMWNDLASFLDERTTGVEHERILNEIVESPEAQGIVLDILGEEERETAASIPPIPIQAKVEVRVCQDFLLPKRTEGAELLSPTNRLRSFLEESLEDRFELYFPNTISYEISLGNIDGEVIVEAKKGKNSITLDLRRPEKGKREILEIWRNRDLLQKVSFSKTRQVEIPGSAIGEVLTFRNASTGEGLGLRMVPVEFDLPDWIGACLISAISGDFKASLQILHNKIQARLPHSKQVNEGLAFLSSIRALGMMKGDLLYPLAPTRSVQVGEEEKRRIFEIIWDGVQETWPETRDMSPPWVDDPKGHEHPIDEELFSFLQLIGDNYSNVNTKQESSLQSKTPKISEGIVALKVWTALLQRDYSGALEVRPNFHGGPDDPFHLHQAVRLAEHFQTCEQYETIGEAFHESNQRLWKYFAKTLIDLPLE